MTPMRSLLLAAVLMCGSVCALYGCSPLKDPGERPTPGDGDGDGDGDAGGGDGDGDAGGGGGDGDGDAGGDGDGDAGGDGDDCASECAANEGCVEGVCQPMQLALKDDAVCAINREGHIVCWGNHSDYGLTYPPLGTFSSVSVGDISACAIRAADQQLECWGYSLGLTPQGAFKQVDVGSFHACGLHTDGSAECWGDDQAGETTTTPGDEMREVAAGHMRSCGITVEENELVCWGSEDYVPNPVASLEECELACLMPCGETTTGLFSCLLPYPTMPAGQVHGLSMNRSRLCALNDSDDVAQCWGETLAASIPGVPARAFAIGSRECGCALLDDGNIACSGDYNVIYPGASSATIQFPAGEYLAVATGTSVACAIRDDGEVVCRGDDRSSDALRVPARMACPDAEGPDPDGDQLATACDNCPAAANTNQADADGDYLGDACDTMEHELLPIETPIGTGGPIAAGDLDGDLDADIVIGSATGLFYRESGRVGGSDIVLISDTFANTTDVALGDMDGDLDLDVVATSSDGNVAIFFNPDVGPSSSWTMSELTNMFTNALGVAVGRLDDDDDLDIVVGSYALGEIKWWSNIGNGTGTIYPLMALGKVTAIEIADINDDDRQDVVVGSEHPGEVLWLENVTDDGDIDIFEFEQHDVADSTHGVSDLAIANLDGIGSPEIVASSANSYTGGKVSFFRDDGAGLWSETYLDLEHVAGIDVGDVDRDGAIDIVACSGTVGLLYRNDTIGGFSSVIIDRDLRACQGALTADIDGDEALDIVFADSAVAAHFWRD